MPAFHSTAGRFEFRQIDGQQIEIGHPAYGAVAIVDRDNKITVAPNSRAPIAVFNGAAQAYWELVKRERHRSSRKRRKAKQAA